MARQQPYSVPCLSRVRSEPQPYTILKVNLAQIFLLACKQRHGNPQVSPVTVLAAISTKASPERDTVITMTAQETTLLPHRLARSAQDLARASLSGVARELKDPRMAKQVGSSSQQTATARQYGDGSQSGEIPRSRPALYSRESSFRNQPNASASRAAEEEFVRFQERDCRQGKKWLSSDLAGCVKINPPEESSGKHEQRSHARIIQNEPRTSHHLTPGSTAKDRATDAIDSHFPRANTNAVKDIKSGSRANGARAAAARRLEQIGAQIQRNLAIQFSQQHDASIQSHLSSRTRTAMDLNHESAHQTSYPKSKTPQSSSRIQSTDESHRMSHRMSQQTHHHHHHHHQHQTPHQTPPSSHENEDDDDEKDDSQLHFHCPYYACHQNLRRLLTNSSSSGRRRSCVHTGCGERLETRVAWNEHITLPHHNLQG